jgi:hypothetical protein
MVGDSISICEIAHRQGSLKGSFCETSVVLRSLAVLLFFNFETENEMALHCGSEEQTVKARTLNQKVPGKALGSIHRPLKGR